MYEIQQRFFFSLSDTVRGNKPIGRRELLPMKTANFFRLKVELLEAKEEVN